MRLFVLNAPKASRPGAGSCTRRRSSGPGMRHSPTLSYVPARLSLVPRLFATTMPPDVVAVTVAPTHDGKLSLGTEVNVLPAAIEACRARGGIVIAQVNTRDAVDVRRRRARSRGRRLRDRGRRATRRAQPRPPDDAARRIGELVAARIADGATLQLGIGPVPDATLPGLPDRRGLAVWSEMFSDGVLALDEAGALDPQRILTASFLYGSRSSTPGYRNPRVQVLRTEVTNAPARIAAHPAMTSINTALQVDLFGQANASRIAARIHSGFGGQTDFTVGALHSAGGQALMALRSWHPKADVSTIVAMVDEPVTSFQHTAVVTEQGVAPMFGHDEQTQARHLIERAAHPSVREELWEEATALGLARG